VELAEAPLVLMLLGLAAYAVLAGADFGAGFWQLVAGRDERGDAIREHAHHAMGPVWEANHVWLVFVLVVCWTAYPEAFGSITSTLAIPAFVAAVGIILRGTAYALRSGTATAREQRAVDSVLGVSSILTPFALGAAIGGIASGRVPVGNAAGDLVTSWLNPTSILVGTMAVATAVYLAAVYLAADAVRIGRPDLAAAFRRRALASGLVAGAVALAGLAVVRDDASAIWDGLTDGAGLAAVLVSIAGGAATLALVWRRRFEPARATAALAVAAIIAGWGIAQSPTLLPGLSVEEAAAGRATLVALLVSIALGAVLLVPSLALLFGLVLRGRFDAAPGPARLAAVPPHRASGRGGRRVLAVVAVACLAAGGGLLVGFDSPGPNIAGALLLLGSVAAAFVVLAPSVLAGGGERDAVGGEKP
jgi:cytochrome d ubiquinol oxidase subunit II